MDYEIVQDLANTTVYDISEESSSKHIVGEIIISSICLISLCADILIIRTIFNFKSMRTVSNVLLGNWIIADACCMLLSPSHYKIISVIGKFDLPVYFIVCGLFETFIAIRDNQMLFAVVVSLDWLSGIYFPRLSEKIKSYYKFIIAAFWIMAILYWSLFFGLCINHSYSYFAVELVQILIYCTLLILVVISLFTIGIHKCTGRLLNYTTHVVMLSTVLIIIFFIGSLSRYVHLHPSLETFIICLVFLGAILNFIVLFFCNRDFKGHFLKLIGGSRNEYPNALSNANENATNNYYRPVRISFHGPTEELITNAY